MRSRGTAAVAVALLVVTAGCGFITGDESLSFSASAATVNDGTLSEGGYEEVNVTERTVTREFSAAGQTREVDVTNQLAQYERTVDLGPLGSKRAAVFVALASPEVAVLGETFNPLADLTEREILQRFETQYEGLSVGSQVDNRSMTVLGQRTGLEKYEGRAKLSGTTVDVYLHVTTVTHAGDVVVTVAIYPQQLPGEADTVVALLQGLEHG